MVTSKYLPTGDPAGALIGKETCIGPSAGKGIMSIGPAISVKKLPAPSVTGVPATVTSSIKFPLFGSVL